MKRDPAFPPAPSVARSPATLLLALLLAAPVAGCGDSEVSGTHITHTTADGLTLSATWTRPSTGPVPTLILLHQPGATNQRHDFDEIWDALAGRGFALLAPDLRSHGLSDSAGRWQDLQYDPAGYPNDLLAWLDFVADREDQGDPVRRDAVGVVGLGTSGSVAAAAIGRGQVECVVAVSATVEEVAAHAAGFPVREPGDDDDSGEARGGDDDDSAADDDDDGLPGDLAMHTVRWLVGEGDEPAATDAAALRAATDEPTDVVSFPGGAHGVEIVWLSDDSKLAIIDWCADKF